MKTGHEEEEKRLHTKAFLVTFPVKQITRMKKNSNGKMCQLAATSWDQSHRQTVFGQLVQRTFFSFRCHIFGAKGSWTQVQHNPLGVKFMTS